MIYVFTYEVETQLYELRRLGSLRRVEPKVFDVLPDLLRRRVRIVSRLELLEHLWLREFVSEDALERHLGAVREAIGDIGELPYRSGVSFRRQ
jgi:DNA-binding winged helix-turn-helix (wHTH) protein